MALYIFYIVQNEFHQSKVTVAYIDHWIHFWYDIYWMIFFMGQNETSKRSQNISDDNITIELCLWQEAFFRHLEWKSNFPDSIRWSKDLQSVSGI